MDLKGEIDGLQHGAAKFESIHFIWKQVRKMPFLVIVIPCGSCNLLVGPFLTKQK